MSRTNSARMAVHEWLDEQGIHLCRLCDDIGDHSGQVQRWLSGNRPTLPLRLKVKISQRTGIPLEVLVETHELQLARDIITLMARDAAARPRAEEGGHSVSGL